MNGCAQTAPMEGGADDVTTHSHGGARGLFRTPALTGLLRIGRLAPTGLYRVDPGGVNTE